MSVNDGSFEKERRIELGSVSPDVYEMFKERLHILDVNCAQLEEVVEDIVDDQKTS